MSRKLLVTHQSYRLKKPFKIAHGTRTVADVIEVGIQEGAFLGRGECVYYERYGETLAGVMEQIRSFEMVIEEGIGREELLSVMPAGAARHAVDSALWDLEAQKAGVSIGELSGLGDPGEVDTAFTLAIESPELMGASAKEAPFTLLKLKFAGDGRDAARLEAVRKARPGVRLIIDANESWRPETMAEMLSVCVDCGVELIEQPLPAGDDAYLADIDHPIPVCADEACHTVADLERLKPLYDVVNIKLDKTGGLTHAIQLLETAKTMGFKIMVGCMVGSALSLRDAYPLAPYATWVDLDAVYLLADN